MSRNTVAGLLDKCLSSGLVKTIPNGYEITEGSFINGAVRKTEGGIYKEICDFCQSEGVTPPRWNKTAMAVILTKYNVLGLPTDNPLNIAAQLKERCKTLPQKVTLPYFVKLLGMEKQYRAALTAQSRKKGKVAFSF